jgi:hypothetical protein
MQMAVGVGRAVVEDELLGALRRLALARIDVEPVPARKHLGLALGQAGAHGKVGLRQEQRLGIVALSESEAVVIATVTFCGVT